MVGMLRLPAWTEPPEQCGANIAAALLEYIPADTPAKRQAASLLAHEFQISDSALSIAIQEISKGYRRQKTSRRSPMDGFTGKPQQYHAEAGIII